jgi:hypothetical protein
MSIVDGELKIRISINFNRPFAKKKIIFFLESTIKNKLKSKISEF